MPRNIYIASSASGETLKTLGEKVSKAYGKSTPDDEDLIAITDSDNLNIFAKFTWAELKTVLTAAITPTPAAHSLTGGIHTESGLTTGHFLKATGAAAFAFAAHGLAYGDVGAEPANANIQSHIGSSSNPHSVTYTQAGAEPANANIQSHIGSSSNPHSVTYTQAGAEPANANIQSHIGSSSNPHSVTYSQAGAEPANANIQSHISAVTGNPHSVTKSDVGLGSVENTALSTWAGSGNITAVGTLASGVVPWSLISGEPATYAPAAHNLIDTTGHPVSGLTTGHFLKATGATTYAFAAHGLTYSDVGAQPLNTYLTAIAALAVTDSNFIVGNGTTWVAENGATVRTSLGLGTGDSPQFTAVNIGHASDTTLARVSAGVVSIEGSNILTAATGQPLHAALTSLAGLTEAAGGMLYMTADNTYAVLGAGTSGYMLVAAGTSAPAWTAPTGTGSPVKGTSPTFTTQITTPKIVGNTAVQIQPSSNSTTGVTLRNAAGTAILTVDTTNSRVGINCTPAYELDARDTNGITANVECNTTAESQALIMVYGNATNARAEIQIKGGHASYWMGYNAAADTGCSLLFSAGANETNAVQHVFHECYHSAGTGLTLNVRNNGSGSALYNCMTWDVLGNIGVGVTTWGTSATRTMAFTNSGTAPSSSPADMVQLYCADVSSSAELRVRDEAGNVTTLGPHDFVLYEPDDADPYPWTYHAENAMIGTEISVDMSGAIRALEALTGKKFIHIRDIPVTEDWDRNQREALENEYVMARRTLVMSKAEETALTAQAKQACKDVVLTPPPWLDKRIKARRERDARG